MAAPTPVIRTLYDTYDDIIVKVTIPTGGNADITATTCIDISTMTGGRTVSECEIHCTHGQLSGFSVILWEDADTDVHLLSMADFIQQGGRTFPIPMTHATGWTGDIKFTTVGLSSTSSHGSFIVCAKKK